MPDRLRKQFARPCCRLEVQHVHVKNGCEQVERERFSPPVLATAARFLAMLRYVVGVGAVPSADVTAGHRWCAARLPALPGRRTRLHHASIPMTAGRASNAVW